MRSFDKCQCGNGFMVVYCTQPRKKCAPQLGRVRRLKCSACGATGKEELPGPPRKRPKSIATRLVVSAISAGLKKVTMGSMTSHVSTDSQNKGTTMLLSIFQLAEKLDISWQDARDWIEFAYLPPPIIVGGLLRFRQADLDAWLAAGCKPGPMLSEQQCEPLWAALLHELESNAKE